MRNLCILGSTGSIGTQTIDIVKRHGGFRILSLAVGSNIDKFEGQIRELRPEKVCVYDEKKAAELKLRIADMNVRVLSGMDGLTELASDSRNDLTVTAMSGMIGIRPTIAAIESGCDVALANKETLVTAGHIIIPLVREKKVRLLPIDSEHSAIFQCLQGYKGPDGYYGTGGSPYIDSILLTASGGPFRGMTYDELRTKTAADALRHPNWLMGPKITVDSASMVNKALEVMEAGWLFGVPVSSIEVVVQPRSIIHSAVRFIDGSIVAQMAVPDMRLPIQYALYYPERMESPAKKLDLFDIMNIAIERPDTETFRGLKLGIAAASVGGSMCTVFNAADECAVAAFLKDRIGFTDIYDVIEDSMRSHRNIECPTLDEIFETEAETYEHIRSMKIWR